jgi:hypothetical protein
MLAVLVPHSVSSPYPCLVRCHPAASSEPSTYFLLRKESHCDLLPDNPSQPKPPCMQHEFADNGGKRDWLVVNNETLE